MWRRALVLGLVGCACATHDAADVGTDAATDAVVVDVGRDTARPDVGSDAWVDVPPGWVLVHGSFPDAAELAFADADLVAATSFPMETCPDRAGCRRIVQTWPSGFCSGAPAPCSAFSAGAANGEHDGSMGTVVVGRQTSRDHIEVWAVRDDGTALAGFRSAVAPAPELAVGDVHAGAAVLSVYAGRVADDYENFALVVPLATPLSFVDVGEVNHYTAALDSMQRFQLGDGAIAAEMTSLVVQRIPLDGSPPAVVTAGEGTLGSIVGQTIVFDRFTAPPGDVRISRPGSPSEVLISGPQTNATRVATDGHDLVWLEYDYDDAGVGTNLGVWAAPYVEHAVDLVPRRIDMPGLISLSQPVTVGSGYAGMPDGTGGLRIYRLSDDYHADVPAPTGEFWYSPMYISATEIAVGASAGLVSFTTQLCFIELASLDWQPPT